MRNHKLKVLSLALLLLSGCSNTGGNGGSGATSANDEATNLETPVRLDQLGVLPASNSSAASYLLQLTNYGKDKYTLDSARVIDLDTGKDSTVVSVASQACSTVSANGSCSIQLTPHTSQSADVKLEVNLKDKNGANTKLVQLIRVSGELNANNGGIVMLNDVDRIVTEDGNYSLSIPVVLGESYDEIKASNGSLICNTPGYEKGSSCTYQVSGKIAGGSAVVSTRLEGIKAGKTAAIQEANTKVEVAKGAHILLSHGTNINHPESSAEIIVFNNGNTQATDVKPSVEAGSGLETEAASVTPCATLAANDSCKVKVSVKSTTNGQGSVKVAYKDGETINTTQTNIRYKVADADAGVTFNAQSNLVNAIVRGKTREAIVNIKNTGNRTLEGISYYLASAGSSGLTLVKPDLNGCILTGAKLAVNESCNLSVKYTPTAATEGSKSINLVINSKYTDPNGQSHALVSAEGLAYSATEANTSNLSWTKTGGSDILSITSNGNESSSALWKLSNTLAADENLAASKVNVSLNPNSIEGLAVIPIENDCAKDATIAGNSACEYKVTYGPTKNELAKTEVSLQSAYILDAKALTSNIKFNVSASSTPKPKIDVDIRMTEAPETDISGEGTSAKPWSFTAYHDKTINLTYTFTNQGNLAADKFNVDSGNLPNGAAATFLNCPNGINSLQLESGNSCTVIVRIPDPELFEVPNLNGKLNSAILKLDLPYSYNYNGKLYSGNSDTKYVNFKRLWANVEHKISNTSSTESAYEFEVKTAVTSVNKNSTYPITVTPTLKHSIDGVMLTSCTIADVSKDSCINKVSLPKNMFSAGKELLVTFETSADGLYNTNVIISDYLVGSSSSTLIEVNDEAELVNAFKDNTSGRVIILKSDIQLTKPWAMVAKLENAIFDGQGHKITGLNISSSVRGGMFEVLGNNTTVRNLNLEGAASTTAGLSVGLLAAITKGKNIRIINSNFKSSVTGKNYVGGVVGSLDGETLIESVTVISTVNGSTITGGFAGYAEAAVTWKNIRVNSKVGGLTRLGGLSGSLYNSESYIAENIIVDAEVNVKDGGSQIGGVFAATRGIKMSNIDATVNIIGGNATLVGGIVGALSWEANKDKLSDVIVRGTISTSVDPKDAAKRISGIASTATSAEVTKAVDMTTIAYTNGTTTTNHVSPLTATDLSKYLNSGNVFYGLPAGATFITAANPEFVAALTATTAAEQKTFLAGKGFDFTNTWTIKKINGVDSIGIKEDSIPQFPKW